MLFHIAMTRRDTIASLHDERFCRMFEFYLARVELIFRHRGHMIWQVQLTRRQGRLPLTRDYMFDAERNSVARPLKRRDAGVTLG